MLDMKMLTSNLKCWTNELITNFSSLYDSHLSLFLTSISLWLSCRSFFELLLFFSKEEFVEKPLKDILDSFQVTTTHPLSWSFTIHIQSAHLDLVALPANNYQSVINVTGIQKLKGLCSLRQSDWGRFPAFFAGVSLSASAAQEHLLTACEADRQSRWPMGKSGAARNPEGGRPAVRRGYAHDHI